MDKLHHDFETWSRVELKKHGLARYARDKSTEVLFLWYALNPSGAGINQTTTLS